MNKESSVAEKAILRKEILQKRGKLTEEERKKAEEDLCRILSSLPVYKEASSVLIYVNYRDELSTLLLIQRLLQDRKKVYVPKVLAKMEMEFYEIQSLEELEKGYMGIPEPRIEDNSLGFSENKCEGKSWMIMPGVAFDKAGNRMGYGGGFYDRYLERYRDKVDEVSAVGYRCQLVDSLPLETHDQKPGHIYIV